MKFAIDVFALFFYLYSVQFVFVPGNIGTRPLMGLIGLFVFFYDLTHNRIPNCIFRRACIYFRYLLYVAMISVFTMILNGSGDAEFVKYFISMSLVYFSCYYVTKILKRHEKYNFNDLIDLLEFIVLIQLLLSLIMFFVPSVKNFLVGIQNWGMDGYMVDQVSSVRLIGFGASFFLAGTIISYCLILLSYKLLCSDMSKSIRLLGFLLYFLILFLGIFMARTTVVGFIFSLILVLLLNNRMKVINLKAIVMSFIFIIGLIFALFQTVISSIPELEILSDNAFELIINAQETGEASSHSTNELSAMYENFSVNAGTLVIGDAHFVGDKGGYYQNTDVGFFRLIFYFGLVGSFFYFLFQYKVIAMMRRCFNIPFALFFVIYMLLLVLNLKGFADLVSISLLFCFNTKEKNVIKPVS